MIKKEINKKKIFLKFQGKNKIEIRKKEANFSKQLKKME